MARPTKAAAAATRTIGSAPNWSIGGGEAGELIPLLSSVNLIREMYIMSETDETVGAMMWSISTTLGQVSWSFVPQIDGNDDQTGDPQAKEYADFCNTMLADMRAPFRAHIDDALTMFWAGFAPIEIVLKQRVAGQSKYTDAYYGVDTLNLLDQTTIWDWVYDNGTLIAMQQMAAQGSGTIPLWKTLLYRTTSQYNNPRGRPLLKNAWRVWRLKKRIQDSEAIGIERDLCGLPMFKMPDEVFDTAELKNNDGSPTDAAKKAQARIAGAIAAVKDMRFNKGGGLLLPSDTWFDETEGDRTPKYDFKIVTTAGQRSIDTRSVIRDYDRAMTRVTMQQFLHLGERSTGSFALSSDQSEMAVRSITYLADNIADEWNLKVTPFVWAVNAFDTRKMPRLRHSDINKDGIAQIGQFLGGIGKATDLWGNDPKMRVALAKAANLDYDQDAQNKAAATFQTAKDTLAEPEPTTPPAPGGE